MLTEADLAGIPGLWLESEECDEVSTEADVVGSKSKDDAADDHTEASRAATEDSAGAEGGGGGEAEEEGLSRKRQRDGQSEAEENHAVDFRYKPITIVL